MRRVALTASRRLTPVAQQRTFIPDSINSERVINEKYPAPPLLTEAEDPMQVSWAGLERNTRDDRRRERRPEKPDSRLTDH